MRKLLIAIDGSDCSMRALRYVGRQFAGLKDLEVTLFHVLPEVPAEFWDDGHILGAEEREDRQRVIDHWLANKKAGLPALFEKAREVLTRGGIAAGQIETSLAEADPDVAGAILDEAERGGYDTLVVGRHGRGAIERFILGSVASKIVSHASGVAVIVVE